MYILFLFISSYYSFIAVKKRPKTTLRQFFNTKVFIHMVNYDVDNLFSCNNGRCLTIQNKRPWMEIASLKMQKCALSNVVVQNQYASKETNRTYHNGASKPVPSYQNDGMWVCSWNVLHHKELCLSTLILCAHVLNFKA